MAINQSSVTKSVQKRNGLMLAVDQNMNIVPSLVTNLFCNQSL